jgi:hypothetical protein
LQIVGKGIKPAGIPSSLVRRAPSRATRWTREAGRIDLTMAFVGARAMFENAGFEVAGSTEAIASKLPRLVMRRMI